jgi:hypothetical protein
MKVYAELRGVRGSAFLAVLVLAGAATIVTTFYRKFFVDQWHARLLSGAPVIFAVDCPSISAHFSCGDQYKIVLQKAQNGQWCSRTRRNNAPDTTPVCGIDPNATDFSRYWHYFDIEGERLYYSWRGRLLITGVGYIGWLATPEDLDARAHRRISID